MRSLTVNTVCIAVEIVRRIGAGEWTAGQVLTAYIEQAIEAHDKTNCLTESK